MTIVSSICGQESLRRNGVALIVSSRVWNAVLECNLKNNRRISVCFHGKSFSTTVIQVYVSTINAKEAEVEWFCEDLQDLLELTPTKDMLFIIGDWNAKVGGQEILGVTGKFGLEIQNEAGQRLIGASLVAQMAKHLPTMQETRVWSLCWKDPLEKGKATHSSIMAWRIPWTKKPGRLQSMGSQKSDMTDATNTHSVKG